MELDRLHPELRPVYKRIPAVPFHHRWFLALLSVANRLQPMKPRETDEAVVENFPLSQGQVRLYRPKRPASAAALLWIHGGGYIMGNAATNDRECLRYVRELGITVVSVDYRLAPKHPFPAPLDDCFEAWQWLQSRADELGIDPARIAVAGQSAGGGLAAGLCQRIAAEGGVQPAAQILYYPMIDDRTGANRSLDAIGHRLWNNKNNRAGWSWYLGQPAGAPQAPLFAAPSRTEDVSNLPPTWLGIGTLDLFFEEGVTYARRVEAAGVTCQLLEIEGAPHGFDLLAPEATPSVEVWRSQLDFLKQYLDV